MKRRIGFTLTFLLAFMLIAQVCVYGGTVPNGYGSFNGQYKTYSAPIAHVTVNGVLKSFPDVDAHVVDGRTLVPVRFISEAMGANVEWFPGDRYIIITKGDMEIRMCVGNRSYTKNGVEKTMNISPLLVNGRTMVPLRFVSEDLEIAVEWDADTYTAAIDTSKKPTVEIIDPSTSPTTIKMIEALAKTESSVANIYAIEPKGTIELFEGLADIKKGMAEGYRAPGVYIWLPTVREGSLIVTFPHPNEYNNCDIYFDQSGYSKLVYDASWVILTQTFGETAATKVWYSIGSTEDRNQKEDFTLLDEYFPGWKYNVELASWGGGFSLYFYKL